MSTKQALAGFIIIIIIILGAVFFIFREDITERIGGKKVADVGVVKKLDLSYPSGWQEERRTKADVIVGILSKANRENPDATLIIRSITGKLEESVNVKTLTDQVADSLSKEIENFEGLVSKKAIKIKSFDAVEVRYKQKSSRDDITYEVLQIIIPTQNQTFFLTFRSPEADFNAAQGDVEKIVDDFGSYLKSLRQ